MIPYGKKDFRRYEPIIAVRETQYGHRFRRTRFALSVSQVMIQIFLAWSGWIRDTLGPQRRTSVFLCGQPSRDFQTKLSAVTNITPRVTTTFDEADFPISLRKLYVCP